MGAKSVWIGIAQMIWAFNIEHAKDADGNIIPIDPGNVTSGINMWVPLRQLPPPPSPDSDLITGSQRT